MGLPIPAVAKKKVSDFRREHSIHKSRIFLLSKVNFMRSYELLS
jgi:hypothetical protein